MELVDHALTRPGAAWRRLEHGVVRVNRGQYKVQVADLTKTGKPKELPLTADIERVLAAHRRWMIGARHPAWRPGWIVPTWGTKAGKSAERAGELRVGNPFAKALSLGERTVGRTGITRLIEISVHGTSALIGRPAHRERTSSVGTERLFVA